MKPMVAFRFVAMAYALAVFMIAPAWLSADEEPNPAQPAPAAEEPAAGDARRYGPRAAGRGARPIPPRRSRPRPPPSRSRNPLRPPS